MTSQIFYPTKVVVEIGGHRDLISHCPPDTKKIFVITGHKSMEQAGVLDSIEKQCVKADISVCIHRGISTNPTHAEVDTVVEACREFNADTVIGIGGGSSVDVAKMVAMVMTNGGSCWDYISVGGKSLRKIKIKTLPLIAVPTTSGTGSESTPYAVVTHSETQMKKGMGHAFLYPEVALLDPELLSLMPPEQIAVTGFDAFGQALEGYTSGKSTFHSEYYGFAALQLIAANFERAFDEPTNYDVKAKMAWGATQAGLSIGLVDVNLAHALSHPLSGRFNIQHGRAVALCTAPAIWFNKDSVGDKYIKVASLFGFTGTDANEAAKYLIDHFYGLAQKFEVDLSLKNYGLQDVDWEAVTEDALEIGAIKTNVRSVSFEQARALYRCVWEGQYA